jgi:hypothetical protein
MSVVNRSLLSQLVVIISLTGCESQPTFGAQLAGQSKEIANIGK